MTSFERELEAILVNIFGPEIWDDSVERTAQRVLSYWAEYAGRNDRDFKVTTFKTASIDQLIMVQDIEFSSLCVHHLLPIIGSAQIGYIPGSVMIGLSKIPRIVDFFAHRPQVQERLTADIAAFLQDTLNPVGVGVVINAVHTCMVCRGVRKHNGKMITSDLRGVLRYEGSARAEFLHLLT